MSSLLQRASRYVITRQSSFYTPSIHRRRKANMLSQMVYSREFLLNTILLPYSFLQKQFMSSSAMPSSYMPSERSPHLRTLMAWPDQTSTDNIADLISAQREVASIANAIAKYEPVWLYTKQCNCHIARTYISENVTIKSLNVTELWIRDTGPVFVTTNDGRDVAGIDFGFNYWGNKLPVEPESDQRVARRLLSERRIPRISSSIIAEGGAIEVDGEGTLIATESSIINPNRNPSKTKPDIEVELRRLLGVSKTIWLPGITDLDITDCHIDALARFGPDRKTIILSRPNDAIPHDDPHYVVYDQAHFILSTSTNAAGERFRIIEVEEALTVPRATARPKEQTTVLPEDECGPATSYVNFYLPNGAIVVPQFGDEVKDREALETLAKVFVDRVVEGVRLDWMAYAGGGVHCATQQWPAVGKNVRD